LDVFVISCYKWSDEDTPLLYQFGQINGVSYDWFDPVPDTFKEFKLNSGSIKLAAKVLDNLGAESQVQESALTVRSMSGRRNLWLMRRLLATTAQFDEVMSGVRAEQQLGRADKVNQLAAATSKELDSGALSSLSDSKTYRTQLIDTVDLAKNLAAATNGFAAETAVVSSSLTNSPCHLVSDSLVKALDLVSWAGTALKDTSTKAPSLQTCEDVLKTIDGATKATQPSQCGSGAASLTSAQAKDYMSKRQLSAFNTMLSCVMDHNKGEPALSISKFSGSKTAALVSDPDSIGQQSIGVSTGGSGGTFRLPERLSSMLSSVEAGADYAFVLTQDLVLGNADTAFDAEFAADNMQGLTLNKKGTSTATEVKNLEQQPIVLKVPFNEAKARAKSQFWRQKINCNFYDTSTGKMNYDGCSVVEVNADHILCNCTHLTDFSAGIDPNKPACGDGKIEGTEQCDDGNTVSGDGCSDKCVVEAGHTCWGVPSVCCAPCQPGSSRTGCTIAGDRNTGTCQACAAGKFKDVVGSYDTTCKSCITDSVGKGNYSLGGAVTCSPHEACPMGQERTGHSITNAGACTTCSSDKFKDTVGQYDTTCQLFTPCPDGTYLSGYSVTNKGTCTICAVGTYKPKAGYYKDTCLACPPNSITYGNSAQNRDRKADCVCDSLFSENGVKSKTPCTISDTCKIVGGWQLNASSVVDETFCKDVDECTANGHNCFVAATCTNTAGSFQCSCNSGYETKGPTSGVGCQPVCGDGRLVPCQGACVDSQRCDDGNTSPYDGCSASCQTEYGFECVGGDASQSDTCRCKQWTKRDGDGLEVIAAKYYSPLGSDKCSRYCSTTLAGPFVSFPEGFTSSSSLSSFSGGGRTCWRGTCETADSKEQGFCRCERYWFRADCNTNVEPDKGKTTATLLNITQDQTVVAPSGIQVFFPANSLANSITVNLDVYSRALLSDISGALAAGVTPVTDIVNLGPEGTSFARPITFTLPTSDSPAPGKQFVINYLNKDNGQWEQIATTHVSGKMTCQLEHFSTYIGLEVDMPPAPPAPPPPPPAPPPPPPPPAVVVEPPASPPPVGTPPPPPPPPASSSSPVGAIVGGVVGGLLLIAAGVAGYFYWKGRATAPIVPLRTGADGLEEPLIVAQPAQDQAATGVSEFVAEAEAVAAPAEAAPVAAVAAEAAPEEPAPVVAEPAAAEPLPEAAVDDGVPGTASTGLIAGANFGGGLNVISGGLSDDEYASDAGVVVASSAGGSDGSDATDPDIVVAFDPADIDTDDSSEVQ
jgi:cysteine-rich repeat protein